MSYLDDTEKKMSTLKAIVADYDSCGALLAELKAIPHDVPVTMHYPGVAAAKVRAIVLEGVASLIKKTEDKMVSLYQDIQDLA